MAFSIPAASLLLMAQNLRKNDARLQSEQQFLVLPLEELI
jgi:hypothetical protein